ncbi:unnamed protein product, partial [Amoebophrya sp. A25]
LVQHHANGKHSQQHQLPSAGAAAGIRRRPRAFPGDRRLDEIGREADAVEVVREDREFTVEFLSRMRLHRRYGGVPIFTRDNKVTTSTW